MPRVCGPSVVACIFLLIACATSDERPRATERAEAASEASEPPRSALGSDVSTLPARYPEAEWVPIAAPLLSLELVVEVEVNGRRTTAVLDTGAMSTLMSVPTAAKLGVLTDDTTADRPIRAYDAHGGELRGERLPLGTLTIGRHRWADAEVVVLGGDPGLFLIGADLLQDVDLYLAADEGLVGLFEAGEGPREEGAFKVSAKRGVRQLTVEARAPGASGNEVAFELVVDTGASGTTVPVYLGVTQGLPADLSYESTTLAVGGAQQNRGRFVLDPLRLGEERRAVGRVLALGSTMERGEGLGLLGNDVLMRYHTVVSFADAELRFLRPPPRPSRRLRGPRGAPCQKERGARVPCVEVRLVDAQGRPPGEDVLEGVCLRTDVHPAYAGSTVELAITATGEAGEPLFGGGALRAYLTVGEEGASRCFWLYKQLERLGFSRNSRLSLRWVRTEGVIWPCDPEKTDCISFTGPLAKLELR